MSTGPGVMQRRILAALANGPATYDTLSVALFGPGWDHGQRANMLRSIGSLSLRHLVEVQPAWVWLPEERSNLLAVALPGTPRAAERPPVNGHATAVDSTEIRLSCAELLRQDPSIGNREDCLSCGDPYADCFLRGDNAHSGDGSHVSYWGDGTPVYSRWNGLPTQCCNGCFHHPRGWDVRQQRQAAP